MSFDQALVLAQFIQYEVAEMQVVAIGRFIDPQEIDDGKPWKISVSYRGIDRPLVITDRVQLESTLRWAARQVPQREAGLLF